MDPWEAFLRSAIRYPDEERFIRTLLEEPEDGLSRGVYADFLEEHGDVRGEFLRLWRPAEEGQAEPAARPRLEDLRSRIDPGWLFLVGDTLARFREFQKRLDRENEPDTPPEMRIRMVVLNERGPLDVSFHGWLDRSDVYEFLATREVAPVLRSLWLRGNGWAANGTHPCVLDPLLEGEYPFANLTWFEADRRGEDGRVIIGDYEENGALARLLAKSPALKILIVPSAPDASFFAGEPHPLETLDLTAGYDTQGFIRNLARSTRFPNLRVLGYEDYCESYMDGWQENVTPFEHYLELFRSPALASIEEVVLREVLLTEAQVGELLAIRKEGVLILRSPDAP